MCRRVSALLLVLLVLLSGPASEPARAEAIVRINGPAYRAIGPLGPDLAASDLVPVPARNPTHAVWAATVAHRAKFQDEEPPENVQVSRAGRVPGATRLVTDFSEVMVARDPTDPKHLLGASKFFFRPSQYDFYTGVFESFDAGCSWSQLQPEGVEDYTLTSDPVTTFDEEGAAYFTLLTRRASNYSGLDMLRKPPGGVWGRPVLVDSSTVTDKQWIIADQDPQGVSPFAGNVYMSWSAVGRTNRIVFARSETRNRSWGRNLELDRGALQGSIPGVAPDGTVFVLYGSNVFGAAAPGELRVVRSEDGGASFEGPVVAADIRSIPYFLPNGLRQINFRSGSLPAFAVSPVDGRLYGAWADYRHGDADVYVVTSADRGETWTDPWRLNDDPEGNGVDQFQPQLSVAPNGRVAAMWFDRRLPCPDEDWIPEDHVGDENFCISTFMTRSVDGGATWAPNILASAQAWDWSLNLPISSRDSDPDTGFIGDYQGIASNDEADFPFWNATAHLGDNPDNRQEVFVARVPADEAVGFLRCGEPTPTPTLEPTPTTPPTPTPTSTATPTAMPTVTPTPTAAPAYLPILRRVGRAPAAARGRRPA